MIVFPEPEDFVMITQDDHAQLSGHIAEHWPKNKDNSSWWADTIFAIYHHDQSWIGLDKEPVWNDKKGQPFDFSDYPRTPKLEFYKSGLDLTETQNAYAALLCSHHYCSFFKDTTIEEEKIFLSEEHERQEKLTHMCGLGLENPDQQAIFQYHFHLLQFCDDVSLFACLHQPGTDPEDIHPWFKNGFRTSPFLLEDEHAKIKAKWEDEEHILFSPFVFKETFSSFVKYRKVGRARVEELGIAEAFKEASVQERKLTFVAS